VGDETYLTVTKWEISEGVEVLDLVTIIAAFSWGRKRKEGDRKRVIGVVVY
jgi:hypothetical protein